MMPKLSEKNKQQEKGFTMIELIITIAVLSFGIVSSYAAFSSIMGVAENSSQRFTAIYLSQEGLEITRNIRDKNFVQLAPWSSGLLACAAGCQADYKAGTLVEGSANQLQSYQNTFLKITADGLYGYDAGTDTKFKRQITITQPSGVNSLKVVSQVTWSYNNKPYSYQAAEYLYNWK
jgi:prepilin-type N-terminal cleavage/methylation domain-containing protein